MTPAPYFEGMADAPAGGACHWLETSDGVRIRAGHWRKDGARGSVLIFPGRTEYVEKYGPIARMLHGIGLSAMAVDWRGQGIAARLHADPRAGHVEHFSDYQKDVAAYVAHARDLGMPEPFYLLGHSMGGCIGLRALHEGLPVASAAFTAPMWGIGLSPILRPTAWAVSWATEKVGLSHLYTPSTGAASYVATADFDDNTLTTCPDMFDFMKRQVLEQSDLQLGGPSIRWLREALIECRTLAAMASPATRCVTFLGSNERIVDPQRIHDRMAAWPNGELVVMDGAEHEVLMERADRRDAIIARLDAHFQPEHQDASNGSHCAGV
ncbi:alpha/beta fold hydrolase [Primorskyibacter sp. S187A]|uniref:alpha/beta fold hydrolase n=1 Tax=Primorskyibacter sp. S187A TaxID=3415130 RepID=UPI003C7A3B0C